MPIRIAPVTSFSSAQRPVSSSSSSQRANCFGSSVLPSVRSVVTTSLSVGGGGLLCPRSTPCLRYPSPCPSPTRGEGTERDAASVFDVSRGVCSERCATPSPLVGEGWGEGEPRNEALPSNPAFGHISA